MAEIFFYVLAALTFFFAMGVVVAKSPMMSVLSLLGSFFCLSVIYLLSGFQFMAAAQILVYAGAILVLFLFVIMLLNLGDIDAQAEEQPSFFAGKAARLAGILAMALALVGLIATQKQALAPRDPEAARGGIDELEGLAAVLFGRYALAFEAVAYLLLAAMVGVIVLAKRERRNTRTATADAPTSEGRA